MRRTHLLPILLAAVLPAFALALPAAASKSGGKGSTSTTSAVTTVTTPPEFSTTLSTPHLQPGSNPAAMPSDLMIADRSNNRIIIVNPKGSIVWEFPQPGDLAPGQTFLIPDDVFFTPDGKYIVATEEDNFVVTVISIATHKIVWRYGTPGSSGMGPNQLWNPDDAQMLPDGMIISPDIKNCRILLLMPGSTTPVHIYGLSTNACYHNPPARFGSPNGAFPMSNGHYLVTEINGDWVDEMGIDGTIYQQFHAPGILYPSDTNEVSPGVFLTADYSNPGAVEEFTSTGQVIWRYAPTSGPGALNQPSLAVPLSNGDIALNDDLNHRVIVIDPKTNQIVWQYGITGSPGTAPGQLNQPDGIDPVPPYSLDVRMAPYMGQPSATEGLTQMATTITPLAPSVAVNALKLRSTSHLPVPLQRDSVVATKKEMYVIGGLDSSGNSTSNVYSVTPSARSMTVSASATLAQPTHDAAASILGGKIYIFGGGVSATTSNVQLYAPTGSSSIIANLPDPRSDLAAAQTPSTSYIIGGYNGVSMDPTILSTTNGTTFTTVGTLSNPVRYPAAVTYGGILYTFGGQTGGSAVTDIQALNLKTGMSWIVGELNSPLQYASAAVVKGHIYVVGGQDGTGTAQRTIYEFDPKTANLTLAGTLPVGLSNSGVAAFNGQLYVAGGEETGGTIVNTIYRFTPVPAAVPHHASKKK